jgi:hypothetical protein
MDSLRIIYFWSIRAAILCAVLVGNLLGLNFAWQPPSASAQEPATINDLEGGAINASTTHERVFRRGGKEGRDKFRLDWSIRFISRDTVHASTVATSYSARGAYSKKNEATVNLARPKETKSRGGGHMLWIFENGVLTFLRTYQGGGMQASFTVARKAAGFTCSANASWPREAGVPSIMLRSFVDKESMEILSEILVASSCQVALDGQAAVQQ